MCSFYFVLVFEIDEVSGQISEFIQLQKFTEGVCYLLFNLVFHSGGGRYGSNGASNVHDVCADCFTVSRNIVAVPQN